MKPANPWAVGDTAELWKTCDIGDINERCVVVDVDGIYITLVFPYRGPSRRVVRTGADYVYLRAI